ncbi:ankyrin [Byssothecium circinans]|uniref:Ankyrin n=1 Tax=Byssothecium circinans TaxID=147558 RepID=A0A6A5T8L9_9PLEO|nr:ankyrin [Byssothecium circinans]
MDMALRPQSPTWSFSSSALSRRWTLLSFLGSQEKTVLPIYRHLAKDLIDPAAFGSLSQVMFVPTASQQLVTGGPELRTVYTVISTLANNQVRVERLMNPENPLDEAIRRVILFFNELESHRFTQVLESFPDPFLSSLEVNIFAAAVELGAGRIVDTILERGLDPSQQRMRINSIPYTPLQRSCIHGWLNITRSILAKNVPHSPSDLFPLFSIWIAHSPALKAEVLAMLLAADFDIEWKKPINSFPRLMPDGYYTFAEAISDRSQWFLYETTFLHNALENCDSHTAHGVVATLLKRNWSQEERKKIGFRNCLSEGLGSALKYNHTEAFEELLRGGAIPDSEVLYQAINKRNLLAIRCLSDHCPSTFPGLALQFGRSGQVPLAEAFRAQSPEINKLMSQSGVLSNLEGNPNAITQSIVVACEIGSEDLLDYLLPYWERCSSDSSKTPASISEAPVSVADSFTAAMKNGYDSIIFKLLANGVAPDQRTLEVALKLRKFDIVDKVLESGLQPSKLLPAFHLALIVGCTKTIRLLAAAGIDYHVGVEFTREKVEYFIDTVDLKKLLWIPNPRFVEASILLPAMSTAILGGNRKMIDLLFSLNAPLELTLKPADMTGHAMFLSPLEAAAAMGNLTLVRELLGRGVNPCDERALNQASFSGNVPMARLLLNAITGSFSSHVTQFGAEALRRVVEKENLVMLTMLAPAVGLDSMTRISGNPFRRSLSALGEAILSPSPSSLHMIEALLRHGANVNSIASPNASALILAISTRQLTKVQLLVSAGADVHAPAQLAIRRSPLQAAVEIGALDIINYLLEKGTNVNALPAGREGGTALQLAAKEGFIGIAALLIVRGGDINAPGGMLFGRTAFEAAAEHGRIEMLMFLVEKGADIASDGGKQYRRSLIFAKANGHVGVVKLVEEVYKEQCENLAACRAHLEGGGTFDLGGFDVSVFP